MKTNLEKGFTILEVLVAMAIVGLLIAAAAFGISAVQRNSRDTKRKTLAQQVKVGYEDFYGNYGVQPVAFTYSPAANPATLKIDNGAKTMTINVTNFGSGSVTANPAGCTAAPETSRDNVTVCVSTENATRGNIVVNLESVSTGFTIAN